MNEWIIFIRNKISRLIYRNILKHFFFRIDPELIHNRTVRFGNFLGRHKITRKFTSFFFFYQNKYLHQTIAGIKFPNPIGLAAGFDKNAQLTQILSEIGFGFAELGSITGMPCKGNPPPRLWRLKKSQALVVYYGLKNLGCEKIAAKLQNKIFKIPMGISVARTNSKEMIAPEEGIKDYVKAYASFATIGSYTTINISCPNIKEEIPFTDAKKLDALLKKIKEVQIQLHFSKPIFLKISPDLTKIQIDSIIKIARKYQITGFICTNLTKDRNNGNIQTKIKDLFIPEKGGISGKVVEQLADEMISYIYKKTGKEFVIIGCGGVFSAQDAYRKIKLGASLVQLITGIIFEGPQLISEINQGLVALLKKDGFKNIAEAVGKGNTMIINNQI